MDGSRVCITKCLRTDTENHTCKSTVQCACAQKWEKKSQVVRIFTYFTDLSMSSTAHSPNDTYEFISLSANAESANAMCQ